MAEASDKHWLDTEGHPPRIKEENKQVTTELEEEDGECEIQKFLEPFPKERLIEFLKEVADKDSDFRDMMKRVADHGLLHRQISVRSRDALTAEALVNYFKNFGQILDCKTCYFHDLRLYYGFILFKNRISACKALKVPMKHIGDIYVYCKFPRKDNFPDREKRRISVSNIEEEIDVEKFTELFSEFGEIEEGPLEFDKIRRKVKGHCSIVYKTRKSAMEAIKNPNKMLEGQSLYCHLDSYSDVSDGDLVPRYHTDPSVPLLSRVPLDARRAHGDAGEDQNPVVTSPRYRGSTTTLTPEAENPLNPSIRSLSRVQHGANARHDNAGPGDQIPFTTCPRLQGLSTPSIPEPENPPNPQNPHLPPTNSAMVPQGAPEYVAAAVNNQLPGTVHGYAGAEQIPFQTYPYYQESSVMPTYLNGYAGAEQIPFQTYPYYQESSVMPTYLNGYAGAEQIPFQTYPYHQGLSILPSYFYPYDQASSILPTYLYPYDQGWSASWTDAYPYGQGLSASLTYSYPFNQGQSSLSAYVSASHTASSGSNQEEPGHGNRG